MSSSSSSEERQTSERQTSERQEETTGDDRETAIQHLQENIKAKKLSRARKYRLSQKMAQKLQKEIEKEELDKDDELEVLVDVMRRFGLKSSALRKLISKKETRGRKRTPLEEREKIWKFWHENTEASTNTSRPAKLRASMIPPLQTDLQYHDGVKKVKNKRNIEMLESPWLLTNDSLHKLYKKYKDESGSDISLGTFRSIRPFYIRSPNSKDIEMCCCKNHLHARWAVRALLKLVKKADATTTFNSYETFFSDALYSGGCCLKHDSESEYIKWECTPDSKTLCTRITENFESLKAKLTEDVKDDLQVQMLHFVKKEEKTKKGKVVKRLKAEAVQANMSWVLSFIEDLLPRIIHHRNLLKNYRVNIEKVIDNISNVAEISLDFSENVTIPIQKEPLSMHWGGCKEEKTVHSGLSRSNGKKTYHAYLSDDMVHDQAFVKVAIMEILENIDFHEGDTIIICSDNCSGQYKSAEHFHDLKTIADELKIDIIRIYGIPGHGKNEVDTVGGTQKIAIRRAVAHGKFFRSCDSCVSFLQEKFSDSESPIYDIREIFPEEVKTVRKAAAKLKYRTVDGSSKIRVMVVKHGVDEIKVAPYLCVCDTCLTDYGSCDLFYSPRFDTTENRARKPVTRQDLDDDIDEDDQDQPTEEDEENFDIEYSTPGTVCAIAADSQDTHFYLVLINDNHTAETDIKDTLGHPVIMGQNYISGYYLEKSYDTKKGTLYYVNDKEEVYFYEDSLVYPFVNVEEKGSTKDKKKFFLSNEDYCDVLRFIEETKLALL